MNAARSAVALAIACIALLGCSRRSHGEHPSPGSDFGQPAQVLTDQKVSIAYRGATVTPLARYKIKAVVLTLDHYRLDSLAHWVPYDAALAWGPMAAPENRAGIDFSQANRWYFWHYAHPVRLGSEQIIANTANVHLLPQSDYLQKVISRFESEDVVELEGFLVRLTTPKGATMTSSLSRTDTGAGACEVMLVTYAHNLTTGEEAVGD